MIGRIQMAKARRAYRKQSEVKRRCKMYLEASARFEERKKAGVMAQFAFAPFVGNVVGFRSIT